MKRRRVTEAREEPAATATQQQQKKKQKKKQKKTKSNPAATPEAAATLHSTPMSEEEPDGDGGEITEGAGGTPADVCQDLLDRYARSPAPQHRHLCASAAAIRSLLLDDSSPLTPPAYFAAAVAAVHASDRGDRKTLAALSAFLSFLLPHVPLDSVSPQNAVEAVASLSVLLKESTPENMAAPTVRALVGSLGLLMQCVGLEDWSAVKLPLEMLLGFSLDRRPKVRKCAQSSIGKVFTLFKGSVTIEKASKVVYFLFRSYMPLAVELSSMRDDSKSENLEKSKHIEVLHMLNIVKLIVPNVSQKIIRKFLYDFYKLFSCRFSLLTRHILSLFEVLLQQLTDDVLDSEAENMISKLTSYIYSDVKNPIDTLLSASTLLKDTMNRFHAAQSGIWIKHLAAVFSSVAGLLVSESAIADHAADILRELINHHIDRPMFLFSSNQSYSDLMKSPEASVIMSVCTSCENVLSASNSVPIQNILALISDLFIKLGEYSSFFMREIVLKLSWWVMNEDGNLHDVQYVKECLGFAVISMGPDKILSLIPIILDREKQSCSNTWIIPILRRYLVGASLQFFIEHIVPLAKSVQETCNRAQTSSTKKNLLSCVDGLWSLLPAFCHYPTDTAKCFDSLAKVLIQRLKEDPSSHEHVTAAVKELVNENKSALGDKEADNMHQSASFTADSFGIKSMGDSYHYTQKAARRNIEVLASSSMALLKSLIDIFFASPPEKRSYLKEAIGCVASIVGSSKIETVFSSSLVQLGLIDKCAELTKLDNHVQPANSDLGEKVAVDNIEEQRCIMMELASAFVEGADADFINIIFDYIRPHLSATEGVCQCEAYQTLSRILKDNSWFVLAQVDELMDLLLGRESSVDLRILRCHFSCLHCVFVHLLQDKGEKTSTKALLILNEIIRLLKDSKEEVRKSAYDTLLEISSSLKNLKPATSVSHHQQLFEMIMGYFAGSPPQIMSGAIAAISLLIYKDADLYFYVPNLMPSVLNLLQSKANEVIKAVLGLIKVLVSCLSTTEIRKLLPDIVNGILPWSSVSKNHFRSKVRTIVEIVIRKCGINAVLSVIPDQYKGFMKTITESQVKANLKGVARSKTAPEPIYASVKRKHRGLVKLTDIEKQHKKVHHSPGLGPRKSSGITSRRLLGNRQRRNFRSDGQLAQKHSGTWEGSPKEKRRKREPMTKNKRKQVHKKSRRGVKDMAVG